MARGVLRICTGLVSGLVSGLVTGLTGLALWLPAMVGAVTAPGHAAVPAAAPFETLAGRLPATQPAKGTPHVLDGRVLSVVQIGDTMLLGGSFTRARNSGDPTELDRSNLLAFNRTTGEISTTFVPQPDGPVEVLLPAPDGQSVYVGGRFTSIGGLARKNLVRLNVSDGSVVTGFKPGNIMGKVNDLRLSGGRLWLAGGFTSVAGQSQTALATIDPTTGAFDPYMQLAIAGVHNGGPTSVSKLDITPDGNDLVAVGNFRTLQGVRTQQALRLDLSSPTAAAAENWRTAFFETPCGTAWYSYVQDVDISPDGSYFAIVTTGGYGGSDTACDSTSRWEIATQGAGARPSWIDNTGGDTMWSVEITDSVIYLGGHFKFQNNPHGLNVAAPGAVSRPGIAALDPANGLPLSWNPTRTRGVGLFDFLVTADGVWVASDTDRIGDNQLRGRIALMPWKGGTTFPAVRTPGLPNDLYEVTADRLVRHAATPTSVGGGTAGPGGIDWRTVKGAFMLNGEVYLATSDGKVAKRTFDGTSWGAPTPVDTSDLLAPLTGWADDVRSMTGLFYDDGRLYFTRAKSKQLFFRYFSPESRVVGSNRYIASSGVTGLAFDQVQGMFVAGDRLYWTAKDGKLRSAQWSRGPVSGTPVPGTATVVGGTYSWASTRAPFLYQDAAGQAAGTPTATFTSSCTDLTCTFDATGSRPGIGSITGYSWSFGDGSTATGATTDRAFATAGDHSVTLTVTNSEGLAASSVQTVRATAPPVKQPPTASFTASCAQTACTFDGSGSTDPDGTGAPLTFSWELGDEATATGPVVEHGYSAPGSYQVTLTVTDGDGLTGSTTRTVSPSEAAVVPVATAGSNGNRTNHTVTVPADVQPGDQLLLFMTTNNGSTLLPDPEGWTLVPGGAVGSNGLQQRVWTKVATAADAGSVVRVTTVETVKSDLSVSAYRATPGSTLTVTSSASAVRAAGLTAYATPEVDVPGPGASWVVSYWGTKSTSNPVWGTPAGQTLRWGSVGSGAGGVSALLTDSGTAVTGPRSGGVTATLDPAGGQTATASVVLTAQPGG